VTSFLVFLGLLGLVGFYVVTVYNKLVRMRNRIDQAWSEVGVLLKRRYDLIPNLVASVQGYASHERGTFDDVTRARNLAESASTVAEQAQAENVLSQALGRLIAVSEAYPQLQAAGNFKDLQSQLTQTEGVLAAARQLYNDDVLTYENARETIPTNLVAWLLGFEPREFFRVDDAVSQVPQVAFDATGAPPAAQPSA
jgi:LemA protein